MALYAFDGTGKNDSDNPNDWEAVAGDTNVEGNETFTVRLSNAANATLTDSEGVAIINDDDTVSSLPSLTILDTNVNEGDEGTRNDGSYRYRSYYYNLDDPRHLDRNFSESFLIFSIPYPP